MASAKKSDNGSFEIRRSRIQGVGAFAIRRIRKDQRVIEEATRRYDDYGMERHHTFLFEIDDQTTIDGARKGNDARYINHSCEPNCEAVLDDGRVFVYALRNIQPGIELTYDYSYEADEPLAESIRVYPCFCGTPNCRGTIVKPKKSRRTNHRKAAKNKT